jgi:hypothetical protein
MTTRYGWQATVLFSLVTPQKTIAQTRSSPGDTVWVAGGCTAGRSLRVEVGYADVTIYDHIYRTGVTICRRERTQIPRTHWKFTFTPAVRVVWSNDSTTLGESVSGDIWQAGGESDALLLGVSIVAHNRILANTIHVASASTFSTTPIGDIIVVRTMLLPPRGTGPRRNP